MAVSHGQRRDVVLQISQSLTRDAEQLRQIVEQGHRRVDQLRAAWRGADIERLGARWDSTAPQLEDAIGRVGDMATALREQAGQQEQASGGAGVGSDLPRGGWPGLPRDGGGDEGGPTRGDGQFSNDSAGTDPQRSDKDIWTLAWYAYGQDGPLHELGPELGYYQPDLPPGWSVVGPDEMRALGLDPADFSTDSSMEATLFRNADGQYVLSFKGSQETHDWTNDVTQALGVTGDMGEAIGQGLQIGGRLVGGILGGAAGFAVGGEIGDMLGRETVRASSQYDQAMQLAVDVENAVGDGNVIMTGHSLGGGLASAAAMATGATAITFDAAGASNATAETAAALRGGAATAASVLAETGNGQIRAYRMETDVLTGLQERGPLAGIAPDALGSHITLDFQPTAVSAAYTAAGAGLGLLTGNGLLLGGLDMLAGGSPIEGAVGMAVPSYGGGALLTRLYGHHFFPMDEALDRLFP